MSDTIQAGGVDWKVYYSTENRQKRVVFAGGAGETSTVKELYLAIQDLFDESTQMDDGNPITGETPTEYTIGIRDAGDKDPWFIDPDSVEHLTGGALKTASWKRVTTSNVGIVRVAATNVDIVSTDVGHDITHADLDSGTLLDFHDLGGGNIELWIRPDSFAAGNNFDSAAGLLTCNGHTATQAGASTTGDMLWANVYNTGIATLMEDTHLYAYQGTQVGDTAPDGQLVSYKDSAKDWWPDGTFDILVMVADQSSDLADASTFIDAGWITFLARQYGTTYSFYQVDLSSGGRNPIPVECGADLNNPTGYQSVLLSGSAGNWNVGDEAEDQTTGARGIITKIDNPGATPTLHYYYIGADMSLVFVTTNILSNNDDTGSGTINGAPANQGPALLAGLSIVHAADNVHDVDGDDTDEYYSIDIDVSDEALDDAYEWAKYQTRRGETGTTNHDTIEGEQYVGSTYRIVYASMTGTVSEGDVVTQDTTLATGVVVARHTTPKIVVLRNTRGTFSENAGYLIKKDVGNYLTPTGTASDTVVITPIKPCPYGIFAGGIWFLAPGAVLSNVEAGDANNYVCIDDTGVSREEQTSVSVAVTNTREGDSITVLRLDGIGGAVEKDHYTIDAAGHSKGDDTIKTTPDIRVSEPGKAAGGTVVVIDVDNQVEHWYRYESWSGDVFTLKQKTGAATGGDTDTLTDSGGGFTANVKVGDLVRNTTDDIFGYVLVVVSDTELTTTVMAQTWNGKNYATNDVVAIYDASDEVYVPIVSVYETIGTDGAPGSESISMVYDGDVPILTRVRQGGSIKPFGAEGKVVGTGANIPTVRTPETIS